MSFDAVAFAALAFALGVKHAFDVDHVVAIGNILTRQERWERAVSLASTWAVGHMITAGLVSAGLYFLADTFLPRLMSHMEALVPFLLIVVGLFGLAAVARRLHYHRHEHAPGTGWHRHLHVHIRRHHEHGAMAGIGVVHGLASNDELLLVLLVGLAADTWWQVLLGVGLFSLGVMVTMAIYATAVHGLVRRTGARWIPEALMAFFSLASLAYAGYLLAGGNGLNLIERFVG